MKKYLFRFTDLSFQTSLALLIFRVGVGAALMTHGYGKLLRLIDGNIWGRSHLFFSEEVSFALITFAEFFCALFVLLGVGTRIFTIPLIYAFIIIVFDAHIDDPFSKMEKGFLFLVSYSSIFLLGPGKFSIDYLLSKKLKL